MMDIKYLKKNQNYSIYKISILIVMMVISRYVMRLNLLMRNRLLLQVFMIQKFIWYKFCEWYFNNEEGRIIILLLF